jgi:hypothetical protein
MAVELLHAGGIEDLALPYSSAATTLINRVVRACDE